MISRVTGAIFQAAPSVRGDFSIVCQPGDLPLPPQVWRNIASSSRKHALTPPSPAVHRGLFCVLWALHVTVAVLSSDGILPCKQAPPWLEAFLAGQVDQGELLLYCPGGQVIQYPPGLQSQPPRPPGLLLPIWALKSGSLPYREAPSSNGRGSVP